MRIAIGLVLAIVQVVLVDWPMAVLRGIVRAVRRAVAFPVKALARFARSSAKTAVVGANAIAGGTGKAARFARRTSRSIHVPRPALDGLSYRPRPRISLAFRLPEWRGFPVLERATIHRRILAWTGLTLFYVGVGATLAYVGH